MPAIRPAFACLEGCSQPKWSGAIYALRGGCMHVRVHCMVQVAVSIFDWPSGSGVEVTLQICSFLNPTLVLVHLHAAVW